MNITKKLTAFYQHLNAADVSRTIFSVKLGEGKNEFIDKFKEKYNDLTMPKFTSHFFVYCY